MKIPDHLNPFVNNIGDHILFLPKLIDKNFVAYNLKCTCGCDVFSAKKNKEPRLIAICSKCNQEIIVFDLKKYKTGIPYSKELNIMDVVVFNKLSQFGIIVAFEYPELDDDEEFDNNDISWGTVYAFDKNRQKSEVILSVEV